MEVILLEKIRNLGGIGTTARVKNGFARNYLIPFGKAVLATPANQEKFQKMRDELEKREREHLAEAQERAEKLANVKVTIALKATEDGKLFGSVSSRMIVEALAKQGIEVKRNEIELTQGTIREIGDYNINLILHSDVQVAVPVSITPLG